MLAVWAEMNVVLADEFRDGNVPAMMAPLTVAKQAYAALPETVTDPLLSRRFGESRKPFDRLAAERRERRRSAGIHRFCDQCADERCIAQGDLEDSRRGLGGIRERSRQRDPRMRRGELCAGGEIGTQRY